MKRRVGRSTFVLRRPTAREAVARGLHTVSVSRSVPADRAAGVEYLIGPLESHADLFDEVDVAIGALSPRRENAGRLVDLYSVAARHAGRTATRFIVIGGFDSLSAATADLDWLFVSPAQQFGSRQERHPPRRAYRTGDDPTRGSRARRRGRGRCTQAFA